MVSAYRFFFIILHYINQKKTYSMKVYNLEEFATKYKLKDIYGAYAAHFSVNGEESDSFSGFESTYKKCLREE